MSDLVFEFLLLAHQYLKPLGFFPPEVVKWMVKVRLVLDTVLFALQKLYLI